MTMVSPDDFVRELAPALRQAASIASALEGRVANRPKRGEATAVKAALTVADTACQEAILVPLFEHFPEVRVEAEEDTTTARLFPTESDALVVVDPIDGTLRFYLERSGPYAVMVGLAWRGEYQAALVALPGERRLYSATRGGGARVAVGEGPRRAARPEASGHRIFVSHDLPEATRASLEARGFEPVPASGGAISVAPLVPGVRAGLRWIRGEGIGVSIRGRIGALIAEEAGALVCSETGAPFPRRLDEPAAALLVAAGEDDLRALQEAMALAS
jgi:myo-inositol-1(or 4)-monophosphatase